MSDLKSKVLSNCFIIQPQSTLARIEGVRPSLRGCTKVVKLIFPKKLRESSVYFTNAEDAINYARRYSIEPKITVDWRYQYKVISDKDFMAFLDKKFKSKGGVI
jgi:hypothetical protein